MARKKVRAGGTLLFIGGTGGRHTAPGLALIGALTAAVPALREKPGTRDRAGSHQPHRCRVCRHTIVGISARQSARCSSRATPQYAADRARRWPGRHSRTRRPHYDQHSPNRRHLRHRRRPTARQAMSPARRDSETDPTGRPRPGTLPHGNSGPNDVWLGTLALEASVGKTVMSAGARARQTQEEQFYSYLVKAPPSFNSRMVGYSEASIAVAPPICRSGSCWTNALLRNW